MGIFSFRSRLVRTSITPPIAHDAGEPSGRLDRLEQKKRPIFVAAVGFMVAISITLIGLEALSRARAYSDQLEEGRVAAANTARAAAEHANATMDLAATILSGIVERVETDGSGSKAWPRLHAHLITRVQETPALQGLFVYDETGAWAATSLAKVENGFNNADRDYFQFHHTHASRALRVGAPIRSRSSGSWILPVSRRLEHPDGSFAGVALATIKVSHFQQYYDGFELGAGGAMLIALTDGTLLTRRPFIKDSVGSSIAHGPVMGLMRKGPSNGTAMLVSKLDGIERLYSYRKLDNYPLLVAAALAKDDIFAVWRFETWRDALVLLAMLAVLLYGGSRLLRQVVIRDRMEIEMRRLQEKLAVTVAELGRLANTDALTGLKNRRFLDERIEAEFARAARDQSAVALIMIDIDFFKRYNDLYGHPGGDGCLRLVSHTIAQLSHRPGDVTARFGGEEFAVLLPHTDMAGALAVAKKMCEAIIALGAPHGASERGIVTISAGAFALVPEPGQTALDLIEAADRGLYAAKTAGRALACEGSLHPVSASVSRLQRVRQDDACRHNSGGALSCATPGLLL